MIVYQCVECNMVCDPYKMCVDHLTTKRIISLFSHKYPEVLFNHHIPINVYNGEEPLEATLRECVCSTCYPKIRNVCEKCGIWYCCEPEYGVRKKLTKCIRCEKTCCKSHMIEERDYEYTCENSCSDSL